MPPPSWPTSMTALALGVVLLVLVSSLLAGVQLRTLIRTRRQIEERIADLTRMVRALEMRLEQMSTSGLTALPTASLPRPHHRFSSDIPASLASITHGPVHTNATPGPTLIAVPDLAIDNAEEPSRVAEELTARFGDIWSLALSGGSAETIACQIGQPIGEVELILALCRRIQASHPKVDHA